MTAEQFRELRAALRMSQVVFGDAIGITAVTVSNYETGKYPVSKTVAMACSELRREATRRIMEVGDLYD